MLALVLGRARKSLGDVANINVVPDHCPVAPYVQLLLLQRTFEKDSDGALCRLDSLAFAIGIRQAQDDGLDPVEPLEKEDVLLDGKLGDALRNLRICRMQLVHWQICRRAVDGPARRDEHDSARLSLNHQIQDLKRSDQICLNIVYRVVVGAFRKSGGYEVKYRVHVDQSCIDIAHAEQVARDPFDRLRRVKGSIRRDSWPLEHSDRMAFGEQSVHDR